MPLINPPATLGSLARSGFGPISINGLGDSITAQPAYQPSSTAPSFAPAWAQSTAYTVGQVVANGGYRLSLRDCGHFGQHGFRPSSQHVQHHGWDSDLGVSLGLHKQR